MTLLFALMLVAILATLGVALEMGVVSITRDRMQYAADSTAREILRERDYAVSVAAESDEYVRDYERRDRNSLFAPWTFDQDGLQEAYEPTEQGAGPYYTFTGGQGETNFGQQFDLAEPGGHSIPALELNCGADGSAQLNKAHGDIVTGAFSSATLGYDGNPIHLEQSEDYQRVDFTPAEAAMAPYGDSVLVRLRRTFSPGQPGNPALDRDPEISSSGWTMPLMLSAGSLFIGTDPNAGYSIRHHGLRFRATAIAQSRPAVRVGIPKPEYGEGWDIGVGVIVMNELYADTGDWNFWEAGDDGMYVVVAQRKFFGLRVDDTEDAQLIGVYGVMEPKRVGDTIETITDQPLDWWNEPEYKTPDWEGEESYAPVFYTGWVPGEGSTRFVCGFTHIKAEIDMLGPDEPHLGEHDLPFLKITRSRNKMSPGQPLIAPRNASALFDGLQDTTLDVTTWENIIDKLQDTPGLIHAPALVR